jgi:hypothetical protein
MAASPPQPSPSLSSNAHFSSLYTNGHLPAKPRPSDVPSIFRPNKAYPASIASTPEVQINGRPRQSRPSTSSASTHTHDETTWGSHFWVTLVDPQTQVSFFACPATGQVSWDPPVGNFVLPPSENGEWWEIGDESRGGIPYYYHTKTGETVWEKPNGFVIPLTVLQNTALGRRLSKSFPSTIDQSPSPRATAQEQQPAAQRSPHIRRKPEVPHKLPGCNLLQAVPPAQRRRAQLRPLCDATLLPIPTMRRRRAWDRRSHPSLAQRRAPRQHPPHLTILLSLLVSHRSRWLLLSSV